MFEFDGLWVLSNCNCVLRPGLQGYTICVLESIVCMWEDNFSSDFLFFCSYYKVIYLREKNLMSFVPPVPLHIYRLWEIPMVTWLTVSVRKSPKGFRREGKEKERDHSIL